MAKKKGFIARLMEARNRGNITYMPGDIGYYENGVFVPQHLPQLAGPITEPAMRDHIMDEYRAGRITQEQADELLFGERRKGGPLSGR